MDSGEERVRQALAQLGTDAASAPDVPAAVTARIGAALRAAPQHAVRTAPRPGRLRIIGVIIGISATAAAIVVGTAMALHNTHPTPAYPAGPTADRITVSVNSLQPDTSKIVVTRP